MDFYQIKTRPGKKKGTLEVYPDFRVVRSKDLMVRGQSFYAIWDEEKNMWSTDEYDVQRIIDKDIWQKTKELQKTVDETITQVVAKPLGQYSSRSWSEFKSYIKNVSDNSHQLDEKLTFENTKTTKKDYISKRLPYSLEKGDTSAWDELVGTLYSPEERAKLEWSIGSIVAGDAKDIQKFIVLYGAAGAGKSTILNIIQKLFEGYYTTFDAKALTSSGNAFATEVFKSNPLVAIQHDGDLSRIEDNTKLNSIVSHEEMPMNEKYKAGYTARLNCFLFMATNRPVKITDAKSGIIRRLIDVEPTGLKIPAKRYQALMSQIDFEKGAIAQKCLDIYRSMGKHYYNNYKPMEMLYKTDAFFNFVEDSYEVFKDQDSATLKQAYTMYKSYCEDSGTESHRLPMYKFREELKNYFQDFKDQARLDGKQVRSYYEHFLSDKFTRSMEPVKEEKPVAMVLDKVVSILDEMLADCSAQYASENDIPLLKWSNVTTKLKDLDTRKTHYVKVPKNHIVIDFDLKNDKGEKDPEKNLEAASKWPPTYAEYSKGGAGIHLHYIYTGDVDKLNRVYSDGIEIKVFTGNSSLRRRLSWCNDIPVAEISGGLPMKEVKESLNFNNVRSEKSLRTLIERNLRKEIHPGTKPSVDFIFKLLEDAYKGGSKYDVTDLRPRILAFANNSTHHSADCVTLVSKMHFKSDEPSEAGAYESENLVFFDVEVFPNLFLVNWKEEYAPFCQRMINPKPQDIEYLLKRKLIGFNCRRYDNHILYARYQGYTNEELYDLSQKIISGSKNAMFGEAYNISYTDVYDFCSKKQSLKKWEIELGIHHQELGLPWDQPVPESLWEKVAEYCDNDVIATETVFHKRSADWTARQILADVAGLSVNDTTNSLTTKIIFEGNRNPQNQFNYRDLGGSDILQWEIKFNDSYSAFDKDGRPFFPGYIFDHGKSTYRDEEPGEGGYVYAEPGLHRNVALLDIASMHPSTIVAENLFGEYTKRFQDILNARIAIKHKEFDKAKKMLGGKLASYLDDESKAKDLSGALKIAINSVYGLTSASFTNPFKDPRNKDNIVAKRGALFMINLKHLVQERGFTVAHIKTDSIKIPNATKEIIDFVMEYGKAYGYTFEHEATYDRMCLVNDAVYIARYSNDKSINGDEAGKWTATGAQFQHPYVFKTLFSKEPIQFNDMCETKTVSTALYIDEIEEESNPRGDSKYIQAPNEANGDKALCVDKVELSKDGEHHYRFIGKAGSFCPMLPGSGGGLLLREKDGKYYAATGTKGYLWMEAEIVLGLHKEDKIDRGYFDNLVNEAVKTIASYDVDFEWFTSDDRNENNELSKWMLPCGERKYATCFECPKFKTYENNMSCYLGYDIPEYMAAGKKPA